MKKFISAALSIILFPAILIGKQSTDQEEKSKIKALTPTREMRAETIFMVRCMEELHLEHRDISELDNKAILHDFLADIDSHKMIFLQDQVDAIVKKYSPTLDIFVSGGSLTPAFNIFETYRALANKRIDWVFDRLNRTFDFSENDVFVSDRKDAQWPATTVEADKLWEQRLKHEILNEAFSLCESESSNAAANEEKNNQSNDGTAEIKCTKESKEEQSNASQPDTRIETAEATDDEISKYTEDAVASKIPEATERLRKRFKNLKKAYIDFDAWVLQEVFLNSISKMYDPHTSFLSKESYDDFNMHIKNSLIGIGAELSEDNGILTIKRLTPGGPAQLSGQLNAGDKITAVAQGDHGEFVELDGMRINKSIKLIRGEKDTIVRLRIETATGDRKTVRLLRNKISLNATRASAKYFELQGNDGSPVRIGVIEFPAFYGDNDSDTGNRVQAKTDIAALILMLKAKGIDGLVLDLRQNGGGLLTQAISIAGLFIPDGPILQTKGTLGEVKTFYDDDGKCIWNGRLAILASPISASASEILIGAMRDYKRALIIGSESTYGKGSVQIVVDMSMYSPGKKLGAAYVTTQKWYLPTGVSTQTKGVGSDIKLPSMYDCFHNREADYKHVLKYDTVEPADFDYESISKATKFCITDELISKLTKLSEDRRSSLKEFAIDNARIQRLDRIINQKEHQLNIKMRVEEKHADEELKKKLNSDVEELLKGNDIAGIEVKLPDVKPNDKSSENEDIDDIKRFDVNLRESLRIISDWVDIDRTQERSRVAEATK